MSHARNLRDAEILRLLKKGYTYEEIGRHFNITKQRVHQIVKSRLSPSGPIDKDLTSE